MSNTTPSSAHQHLKTGAHLAAIGMAINAGLTAIKIFAGMLGHSHALIADGFESALDVFSSLVMWGGMKYAARPPDASHPYGHGKAEPVAAIVGSLTIIGAAIGLAMVSCRELFSSSHRAPVPFTLLVLIITVLVKMVLSRIVARVAKQTRSIAIATDATHHYSDALTSAAAFVGISIALLGGRGYESADDWAAAFACAIIGFNGIRLLKPALFELMDTAPSPEVEKRVRELARTVPGVEDIDKCRVRKMGLVFYVDLDVRVNGEISVREGHRIAHCVKDTVRASDPEIADVLVHIEPVGGLHGARSQA